MIIIIIIIIITIETYETIIIIIISFQLLCFHLYFSWIFLVLGQLINACILHGYTPLSWLCDTIMPLLNTSVTASYRPVTLSSLFEKIIDVLILNRYHYLFIFFSNPLGLKKINWLIIALLLLKKLSHSMLIIIPL